MDSMDKFAKHIEIKWSDLDPNFHLRHSVYYDIGAYARISFLNEYGMPSHELIAKGIGPILFREECVFKKEIVFADKVYVTAALQKNRRDSSRWTMIHEIYKNDDILAAIITIDGAWIDLHKRKLAIPPKEIMESFNIIPKTTDFSWTD